jgi:transcriptional regulator with XRE-family HTH domain
MTGGDESERSYVVRVGAWVRSIRRQQHLSLQDVEAATDYEFRASVLGAYERGERAISVPVAAARPLLPGSRRSDAAPR